MATRTSKNEVVKRSYVKRLFSARLRLNIDILRFHHASEKYISFDHALYNFFNNPCSTFNLFLLLFQSIRSCSLKWEIVRVTCNLKISQGKLRDKFSIHSFSFVEFKEEETPLITKKGIEGQKEKKENKSAMHLIFWPQRDRD